MGGKMLDPLVVTVGARIAHTEGSGHFGAIRFLYDHHKASKRVSEAPTRGSAATHQCVLVLSSPLWFAKSRALMANSSKSPRQTFSQFDNSFSRRRSCFPSGSMVFLLTTCDSQVLL